MAHSATFALAVDGERLSCVGLIDGVSGEALLYLRGSTSRPAPPLRQWCLQTHRRTLIGGTCAADTRYVLRGGWWLLQCADAGSSSFGLGYPVQQEGCSAGLVVARGANHYYCLGWAQVLARRHQVMHCWRAAPPPSPPGDECTASVRVKDGAPWLQALLQRQGEPGTDADYRRTWWQCVPPGATVSVTLPGGAERQVRIAAPEDCAGAWPEPVARGVRILAYTVRLPRATADQHWLATAKHCVTLLHLRCEYRSGGPPQECCAGELAAEGPRHQPWCPWAESRLPGAAVSFTCAPGGWPGVPSTCNSLAAGVLHGRVRALNGEKDATRIWNWLAKRARHPPAMLTLELAGLAVPDPGLVTLTLQWTD